MRHFAHLDPDGYPLAVGSVPDGQPLPEGATAASSPVSPTARLVDGAWEERPRLPEPGITGGRLVWAGLPPGTVLRVEDDEVADLIAETAEHDLLFEEPGTYVVFAEPPRPWLPREVVVRVG